MNKITLLVLSFIVLSCHAQPNPNDVTLQEEVVNYTFETVADGIPIPWGMAWLPDGSMLITEKSGILYHLKNGAKTEIKNVPEVYIRGQGGLLDIVLHPDYDKN
ncbi:MAG: glucose/arabinose dehydrogenase, partial [Flavobacterium sp.]